MKLPKKVLSLISLILTAALLVFAFRYISTIVHQADFSQLTIHWWLVVLAAGLFTLGYCLMSVNWLLACKVVEASVPDYQFLAFFASQPYKYLPTSLFTFSFRAVYARKLGLGVAKSSIAQLVENASMLTANATLFLIIICLRLQPLISLLIVGVVLLLVLLTRQRKTIRLRYKQRSIEIQTSKLATMFTVAFVAWFISGLAFVALNRSLGLQINLVSLLAANTLAFSLSILAVFAPGGLGVRELVFRLFSVNNAAIVSWRILSFTLDFLLGGLAILIIRWRPKLLFAKKSYL